MAADALEEVPTRSGDTRTIEGQDDGPDSACGRTRVVPLDEYLPCSAGGSSDEQASLSIL